MMTGRVAEEPLTAALTATPIWLSAKIMPLRASTIATNCTGLSRASSVGRFCSMQCSPSGRETNSTIGMAMTKMARHGKTLDTAPPTVGPMAGATVITSEPTPMRRPTLLRGDCSRMMFIISGVATPEPMPWITRASRMTGKVWPTIMIAEPVTARTTAAMNRDFSRKRRFRNDDSGIVAATTSRYTVVIHCTVAVFTPNSVMSSGNSTVITVSVRMPMNASEPTATMTPIRRLGMRSCEVEVM